MLLLDETPYQEPKEALQVAPTGIVKASAMAAAKLPVDIAAAGTIIAGGLDELIFGRDNFFKLYDEEIKPIQDRLTPDPGSVSTAGRFISGIAGFAPALLTGGLAIPLLAGSSAINTGADLVDQGVTPEVATGAAMLAGATGVAMAAVPQAGKTWGKTLALAAFNPVIGAASVQAEKSLLESAGYENIAENYDPFDLAGRGVDAVLGLAFGAVGKYANARKTMLTQTKDSIDTVANWQRMFKDTPFDVSSPKTADLGYKAMQKALEDIGSGRNVDLSGIVPDAPPVRLGPDAPVRAEAVEARQALVAAEKAYHAIDAPTPRDVYFDELKGRNKGQVPDEHLKTIAGNENLQNRLMPSYFDVNLYDPYIRRLWKWHQETGMDVSRADLDIGHVTGMNDALGHHEADKHLRAISDIIKDSVEAHGIKDATFSRYGGDELAVEAIGVPKDVLDKAVQDAKLKVDQYAKDNGLLQLVSEKNPKPKDVTLHVKTSSFSEFSNYDQMRSENDAKEGRRKALERGAKENELRSSAGKARDIAPEGRPAGSVRPLSGDIGRAGEVKAAPQSADPAAEVTTPSTISPKPAKIPPMTPKKGAGDIPTGKPESKPEGGNPFKESAMQDIFYHGGESALKELKDTSRRGGKLGSIYLTDSRDVADAYAKTGTYPGNDGEIREFEGKVTKAYVDIKNPLTDETTPQDVFRSPKEAYEWLEDMMSDSDRDEVRYLIEGNSSNSEAWAAISSASYPGAFLDAATESFSKNEFLGALAAAKYKYEKFTKHLSEMGFDGFVYKDAEAGGNTIIPFRKEQVRIISDTPRSPKEGDQAVESRPSSEEPPAFKTKSDISAELKEFGDIWQDRAVVSVEQRLSNEGDFLIHTGTDALGKPTNISARDFLDQAKAEYKALEIQQDIYNRISDCLE